MFWQPNHYTVTSFFNKVSSSLLSQLDFPMLHIYTHQWGGNLCSFTVKGFVCSMSGCTKEVPVSCAAINTQIANSAIRMGRQQLTRIQVIFLPPPKQSSTEYWTSVHQEVQFMAKYSRPKRDKSEGPNAVW